ncbi:hypothetical protein G8764_16850 [Pseudomaricurvus alcaniphilus]|uniref:hypothetical protein n=1 Tax=Pseudomaricurvus alcaniphilus TaxID=1166482 RepID=UPI00140D9527|nr:hypothetical protein [Pseudomaricurvus alcaniphilus]NHN38980.1 hypothetical protein [Pseudomaricurvus alcaniphilus]
MNAAQTVTQNQDLADFSCGKSRNPLNAWSATNIPSDSIPIIIPHSNNKGCSSGRANFIAMTRPTGIRLNGQDADSTYVEWYRGNSTVTHDRPSPRGLAHELGHFFQLAHAYRTAKTTKSAIETMLKNEETATNHASIHNLDGDRYATTACSGKGGCYLATHDTMPAFSEGFWDNQGVDRCDDGPKYSFSSNFATFKYSAAPHDVMSYIRCDRTNVLSKDQVRAVRQSLYGLRNALIQ